MRKKVSSILLGAMLSAVVSANPGIAPPPGGFGASPFIGGPIMMASPLNHCALTDIIINAEACTGFLGGNVLSASPSAIAAQKNALNSLGFTWDGNFNTVETLSGLSGSHTVNFNQALRGITYVGFHFGNGVGGPGNGTAFYRLNAGNKGLDILTLNYAASSNAVLYHTTIPSPVPEPETYAQILAGLGCLVQLKKRKK